MQRAAVVAFGMAVIALAVPVHSAGLESDRLLAHVPFAFEVADVHMPPGDYTIREGDSQDLGLLEIRSSDSRHAAFVFAEDDGVRRHVESHPRLVFDRYGDQRFLRVVRLENGEGERLSASRDEFAAARAAAGLRPTTTSRR